MSGEDFGNCVDNYGQNPNFDACMYTNLHQLMLDQAFEVYQANRRNQKDICPNSCLFTNMYFGPPVKGANGPERPYAWGVFYFRRDIKLTSEHLLYSLLSMVAEIGGYVGLLLGASLVNIGKANSWILDFCLSKKRGQNDPKMSKKRPNTQMTIN